VTASGWPYLVLFLVLLLMRLTVLEGSSTPFKRSRLSSVPNPPLQAIDFGNQLALIGSTLSDEPSQPADRFIPVTLYWQALADLGTDYHISLQLADLDGNRFGQSDQYPGLVPTGGWKQTQYLPDRHQLAPAPGTPPGEYQLIARVYSIDLGAAQPLELFVNEEPAGMDYLVGRVRLTSGWRQPEGELQVVEAAIAGNTFGVGEPLPFTLVWRTGAEAPSGVEARFTLANPAGRELSSTHFSAAGPGYPASQWQPNQLIRFPHRLILPADLPAGAARASLRFVYADGSPASDSFDMGEITITAPERSFVVPPMAHRLDHDFNESIRLLGYDVSAGSLILYWSALKPVPEPLTVFVHYFDAGGRFIGGGDSPPARSTTSWLAGEIIADPRPAPSGDYFEVGLYDAVSGDRFGETYVIRP
jgi:hypothetical protein